MKSEEEARNEILIRSLYPCNTEQLLNEVFESRKVEDKEQRIIFMNDCMGNPKTFFSTGGNISLEDRYSITVQMFLSGAWKLANSCKK